jgi:hypothetical protein
MGKAIPVNQVQGLLGTVEGAVVVDGYTGGEEAPSVIDGVAMVDGGRYLLTSESTPVNRGIWVFDDTLKTFSRPEGDDNLQTGAQVPIGSEVFVVQGKKYGNRKFRLKGVGNLDGYENRVLTVGTDTFDFELVHDSEEGIIGVTIGTLGVALSTGFAGRLPIAYDCRINYASIIADQEGSISVDVRTGAYADTPLGSGASIVDSAPITITAPASKNIDGILSGWSKDLTEGNWLEFYVNSVTDIQQVSISMGVQKQ